MPLMNSDDRKMVKYFAIFAIFVVFGIPVLANGINALRCYSQASGMDLPSSWGPLQGCLVSERDGRWYPIDRVHFVGTKE